MAKRRTKKRTHVRINDKGAGPGKSGVSNRSPKTMVIRMGAGEVGSSVSQLVKDVRAMMEPDTASRLKERRANKLKDYVSMAGPLGVTHLLLISRSSSGNTNLRIALTPRGPTLHFRITKYSLCRDIAHSQKRPRATGSGASKDYATAPLLVMNNFTTPDAAGPPQEIKQLESLTTTIFQSLFPAISPHTTPISSIRRIMLLNREHPPSSSTGATDSESGTFLLNLRHYAITTRQTGVSRRVRRLDPHAHVKNGKPLPNLGKLDDVADYLLSPTADGGYTSASETELDTDAEVEVLDPGSRHVLSRRELARHATATMPGRTVSEGRSVEKRAVKLVELGPRLKIRLVKIEEGVCEGRTMWHEFVVKSRDEEGELEGRWEGRRREKEGRRRVQRENVERKRRAWKSTQGDKDKGDQPNGVGGDNEDEETEDDWDSEDMEGEEIENEQMEGDDGNDDGDDMEEGVEASGP